MARTVVPCFDGPIPEKPTRGSVEGVILHKLIELYDQNRRRADDECFRPRRALIDQLAQWAKENGKNPRIDSKTVAAQVRIEEVLTAFGEARSHLDRRLGETVPSGKEVDQRSKVFNGAESLLRDPESKLLGRADFITRGEIVDFKSGERADQHVEQVMFYGALYLALTGMNPASLVLHYTSTSELINVPVPSRRELQAILDGMRKNAVEIERQVEEGLFPARPEPTRCSFCHVRGLCEQYWDSQRKLQQDVAATNGTVCDYVPSDVARMERAALGVYVRDTCFEKPALLYLPECDDSFADGVPSALRVLAVKVSVEGDGLKLGLTRNSEIYQA